MALWKFRDFVSPAGNNQIARWYKRLSPQAQSDFDTLIGILSNTLVWAWPDFEMLSGAKWKGIGEIRWKTEKVQHRIFGYRVADTNEFVFLLGCTHKQNIYDPANAKDDAVKRRGQIERGVASSIDHEKAKETEE